jgi:hypothetical protein
MANAQVHLDGGATARIPCGNGDAAVQPSYGWQRDDQQVAGVLNYIRNSWGGAARAIAARDVNRVRSDSTSRPD